MTELNTQIESIVSEIIGAIRKSKTLEDLAQVNTNGINDITNLVKNLSLYDVVGSTTTKDSITADMWEYAKLQGADNIDGLHVCSNFRKWWVNKLIKPYYR